jgi:hypothetical protein
MRTPRRLAIWTACCVAALLGAAVSGTADASSARVAWSLQAVAQPTSFQTIDRASTFRDRYIVFLTNVGGAASNGRITLTDTLPEGVTTAITPVGDGWSCSPEGAGQSKVTCTTEGSVTPLSSAPPLLILVDVTPGSPGPPVNEVHVAGGLEGCGSPGAPDCPSAAGSSAPTPIDAPPLPFHPLQFASNPLDEAGAPDVQAGGHPNSLSTSFVIPSAMFVGGTAGPPVLEPHPVEHVKQVVVELPSGIVADAQAAPTCDLSDLLNFNADPQGACAPATRIGTLTLLRPSQPALLPVFNITPEHGYPVEFAVDLPAVQRPLLLYGGIGPAPDYRPRVTSSPSDSFIEDNGVATTLFGDPAAIDGSGITPVAFFTNPSDCSTEAFSTSIHIDSWEHPARFNPDGSPDLSDLNWKNSDTESPPVAGCAALQFHPSLSVQPTSTAPDSPTGLNVDLRVPQNEDPNGLATPPLKDATVTLPRGLVISPSAANGLQACTDAQIALSSTLPASCPQASKVGTVTVHTPILREPLEGQLFLGQPECSPCSNADAQAGRLARGFLQVHSDRYGITLKIPSRISIDPSTGQLTASFRNSPQQPFSDLELTLPQSDHAALATPNRCGSYTTTSVLVSWSAPQTPDATPSSSFAIGCAGDAFGPPCVAGTIVPGAGSYSPFTLTFSRNDTEQSFSGLELTLPRGLLAKLGGVAECGGVEVSAGHCPADSRIGTVTVGAGPGAHPFYTTGSAYLTGPYNGGPFGVAVIVQAVAGPFNLGTVVVRNSIRIDRSTAQATVVSDPFPTMLAGIPIQLRTANVTLDRGGFTFNPTNCNALAVTGRLLSTEGASAPFSSQFRAVNCAMLPFKPSFRATTAGRSSKAGGASLDVKVLARGGPQPGGGEANIRSVKVDLPKQLPSRLTTLQKACVAEVFEANPVACTKESDVGTATANTPVLANPLSGPAYLVSHGGAAFPDLEIVLQGEGIVLILDGHTHIKKGITSSDFATVPDAPISSFELKLPTGRFSVLSPNLPTRVNYSFCSQKLTMPTLITAQNGAVVKQATKIAISGCPKAKKAAKKRAKSSSSPKRGGATKSARRGMR